MIEESADGPVFTFAITISCHMPYNKPEERKRRNALSVKENLLPENFILTRNFV